jgi:signal transduction histidine kinase
MTLGFCLILVPLLFIATHLLMLAHAQKRANQNRILMGKILGLSKEHLGTPGWQIGIASAFRESSIQSAHVGATVTDQQGNVLWRSTTDAPTYTDQAPDLNVRGLRLYLNDGGDRPGELMRALMALTLISVVAFAIGAWLMVGRTLSPIRNLARQAAADGATAVDTRLVSPSQDVEIVELVGTLNGFLDRMEQASHESGRFYAAASHELRTPLQALSGHLEVALGQPRSAEAYETTLQEALIQTHRLGSLVEGILLLHQLQGQQVAREPVRIADVVEEVLDGLQPLLEARRLQVILELDPDLVVQSAPVHARALARNLLENAAKYAREGSAITVSSLKTSDPACLKIENDLPPGAGFEAANLGEPFYRNDSSRSQKSGGNGLGLAICQAVARTNRWRLELVRNGNAVSASVEFLGE